MRHRESTNDHDSQDFRRPVEVAFGEGQTKLSDLSRMIDAEKRAVRSATGELVWNYRNGLCMLDAPKAQGVTGNLAVAGTLALVGQNGYATFIDDIWPIDQWHETFEKMHKGEVVKSVLKPM